MKCMKIPQATLAIFDVGFDPVTALPGALVSRIALGKLCVDKSRLTAAHDSALKARNKLVEQWLIAKHQPGIKQRGTDCHVRLRHFHALLNGSCRMADFEFKVPQYVENIFNDRLTPRRLLRRQQEQQINV